MTSIWRLTTNEGEFILNQRPTVEQMLRYIKAKRRAGMAYDDIKFTWTVVLMFNDAEGFVTAAERAGEIKEKLLMKYDPSSLRTDDMKGEQK